MCGIAGIVRLDGSAPGRARLTAMADALAHRGPDDAGVWVDGTFGFSHRRLSIIDLGGSPQPMTTSDGRFTVAFNGEILNYRELRRTLDYPWSTDGDTEVLLAAHHRLGTDAPGRLLGQFAYAIHDREDRSVTLHRDPLGILPLYYAKGENEVVFASEIKAILAVRPDMRRVDEARLPAYLTGRSVPSPNTLFAGISKVPPGHRLRITANGVEAPTPFWAHPPTASLSEIRPADAVELVRDALTSAVERALVADVPVGAYLSGGVDSSLIAALARRARPDTDLHTFSAGFGDARTDELHHAAAVSRALGTVHHPVLVTADDFVSSWRDLTWHRDAPLSEPADVAVARLAVEASRHVKVVLSGEGSDELFAGYPKYRAARAVQALSLVPGRLRTPALSLLSEHLPASMRRFRTLLRAAAAADENQRLDTWFAPFSLAERHRLVGSIRHDQRRSARPATTGDIIRRMSIHDTGAWLSDNLLERGDRMTMASSIELRPPFLDKVVVELALRLPSSVKLRHGTTKWVVKEMARGLIPSDIIDRPKAGFRVPLDAWFRGGLREMANDMLLSRESFVANVFDRSAVEQLLRSHDAGRRDEALGIWTLLSLEVWHDVFIAAPDRIA